MMVFIDTSAWLAITNKTDQNHIAAKKEYTRLMDEKAVFVTTDYILAETITRIRYDSGHKEAVAFFQIITQAAVAKALLINWITPKAWEEAWRIFVKYADQKFSITDCTSFVAAGKLKIKKVFAFDDDFKTMGFWVMPQ